MNDNLKNNKKNSQCAFNTFTRSLLKKNRMEDNSTYVKYILLKITLSINFKLCIENPKI